MTTSLNKPVRRKSESYVRDRSKFRRIIVTLYPGNYIGLRLENCRKEETITLQAVYQQAIMGRLAKEKADKAKNRKFLAKRGRL